MSVSEDRPSGSKARHSTLTTILHGGPTLLGVWAVLREILEKFRLILHAGYCFGPLPEVFGKLPRKGLLLAIPNLRIRSGA